MSTTCATKVSPAALSAGFDETAGLDPRRWRALPIILIGSFLAFLDFFIVNIALPAMRADLRASPAQLQFIVAAYGIAFGVSLITGGRLGDIFGRKRVFLIGISGFTITSALCGLSPTPETLIASRVAQAICAATVTPQVLAIIRVEFATSERPIAIGLYGASMGLASITAQLLGGLLVSLNLFGWSWRLIFLINIPIGLVAIALVSRMIRESRGSNRATLDLVGVALASLGLFLLIYPIVEGRESGWPAWSFAMLATMVPVLVGFVLYERQVIRSGRTPLIALHLFRIGALRLGLVVSVVFFSTAGVFFVVLTVFLQAGLGLSAFRAGLMFLPFAIGFSASSTVSGPVANRIGPRIINLGTFLMALGLLGIIALARIVEHDRRIRDRQPPAAGPDLLRLRPWPRARAAGVDQHGHRRRRGHGGRRGIRGRPFPDDGPIGHRARRRRDRRRVFFLALGDADNGDLSERADRLARLQLRAHGRDVLFGAAASRRVAARR